MKSILTIALVLMTRVMVSSAPVNHNAFSATPDNNQTKTTKTTVNVDTKPATVKTNEAKSATSSQPAQKDSNGDFKSLQRGKKKLEFKYNLYA
ncbi:MAG TPA: hypothetical protein VK172_14365 [Lentimicrobium sp.]|nr:hypothetical protein [Lentimicrobium sp.]